MEEDKRVAYLYKFDIDEYGYPVLLPCPKEPHIYIMSYMLLFDRVVIQTSAPYKREDLETLREIFPELFMLEENNQYIISNFRGIDEKGNEAYIDSRYKALTASKGHNKELDVYNKMNARKISKSLDAILDYNKQYAAVGNTDKIFRASTHDYAIKELKKHPKHSKLYKGYQYLADFSINAPVFQTFVLENILNHKYFDDMGHMIKYQSDVRKLYSQSNTMAVNGVQLDDCHMDYKNVSKFLNTFGLSDYLHIIFDRRNATVLLNLRKHQGLKLLKDMYFSLDQNGLLKLFTANGMHKTENMFYKSDEFKRFCNDNGFEYRNLKKNLKSLYEILHQFKKG